jgi:hypothetical protein
MVDTTDKVAGGNVRVGTGVTVLVRYGEGVVKGNKTGVLVGSICEIGIESELQETKTTASIDNP